MPLSNSPVWPKTVLKMEVYSRNNNNMCIFFVALLQSSPAPPTSEDLSPSSSPLSSAVCTVAEPSSNVNVVIERLDKEYIEIEQLVFEVIKCRKVPLKDMLTWIRFPPVTLRSQFADLVQTLPKLLANVSSFSSFSLLIGIPFILICWCISLTSWRTLT